MKFKHKTCWRCKKLFLTKSRLERAMASTCKKCIDQIYALLKD